MSHNICKNYTYSGTYYVILPLYMLRTHHCGALRAEHVSETVTLYGWVHRIRNVGTLLWIEIRDKYGHTQLIFERGKTSDKVWHLAHKLGREDVIETTGIVVKRSAPNTNLSTGAVEVSVESLKRLATSEVPPFLLEEESDGGELLRLKYRYLDLRRGPLQRSLHLRHRLLTTIRTFLEQESFTEVETPLLIKSTPEGARDFVVPSRLHDGQYYALPQSPQLFKQLLMIGGMDRYYQFARCFRDEDHRSDRQPEFTQLDCELSFVSQEDILNLFEQLLAHIFSELLDQSLPLPFPRLPYTEAMKRYGTDKPDLRYEMPLFWPSDTNVCQDFPLFVAQPSVAGLVIENGIGSISRRTLNNYKDIVCSPQIGAAGLAYLRVGEPNHHEGPLTKHFSQKQLEIWGQEGGASAGDLILFIAGPRASVMSGASELRSIVAEQLNLYDPSTYQALWVTDFPLFTRDEEHGTLRSVHHPFTAPIAAHQSLDLLHEKPLEMRSEAYDLVVNGTEIGGGSIRIHSSELQKEVLAILGHSSEAIEEQFGFLLEALRYGAPPHGGIAVGIDRLCALMMGPSYNIRDCIAFPKNTASRDLMIGAPSSLRTEEP